MSEDREEDSLMDFWYTSWEQQCLAAIEEQPDYETQLHNQKEIFTQEIWSGFQTTASAIAQLYKGKILFFFLQIINSLIIIFKTFKQINFIQLPNSSFIWVTTKKLSIITLTMIKKKKHFNIIILHF